MQIAYDTTTVSARTRADKSIISKQIITIEALENYVISPGLWSLKILGHLPQSHFFIFMPNACMCYVIDIILLPLNVHPSLSKRGLISMTMIKNDMVMVKDYMQ